MDIKKTERGFAKEIIKKIKTKRRDQMAIDSQKCGQKAGLFLGSVAKDALCSFLAVR